MLYGQVILTILFAFLIHTIKYKNVAGFHIEQVIPRPCTVGASIFKLLINVYLSCELTTVKTCMSTDFKVTCAVLVSSGGSEMYF